MDFAYEKFQQGLLEKLNLDLGSYKPRQIRERIEARMNAINCESFERYLQMLIEDRKELEYFVNVITVNTSEFFRDESVFSFLQSKVFPEVVKRPHIRIWSAGCSIGAEPYSIALILNRLGLSPRRVHILGTDINVKNLDRAKAGIFKENHVRNVPKDLLLTGFKIEGSEYHVVDKIKEFVTFKQHDLLTDPYLPGWDMIFCRNVFIYLTQEAQDRILEKFCNSMKAEGYLVIGCCEQIFNEKIRERLIRMSPSVFQLKDEPRFALLSLNK